MDEVAFIAVARHAPRAVGIGRSWMQVDAELVAEDLPSGEREPCTRECFVMIALDAGEADAPGAASAAGP